MSSRPSDVNCKVRRIMSGVLCGRSVTEREDLVGRFGPFEPPGKTAPRFPTKHWKLPRARRMGDCRLDGRFLIVVFQPLLAATDFAPAAGVGAALPLAHAAVSSEQHFLNVLPIPAPLLDLVEFAPVGVEGSSNGQPPLSRPLAGCVTRYV